MGPEIVATTLPSDSMKTTRNKNRNFGRRIIMVGLMACLCLSTSEGLRLAPFPIFASIDAETANAQVRHHAWTEISNHYNPTTVPTRQMKRGKQQVVQYESAFSANPRLAAQPIFLPVTGEAHFVSPLLSTRIPSRAPPFVS